ncbi:MAG: hypothetical protein IE918_00920 [Campylobacterales bacterium]|nr:hypothetical protein [Campylobacterales bacterium]
MGSEIHKTVFTEEDYQAFEKAWLSELDFVQNLFEQGSALFSESKRIGYELETCILDAEYQPAPVNQKILAELDTTFLPLNLQTMTWK